MSTHNICLAEAILMSTHNIRFYGEMTKIILQLSLNALLICSSVNHDHILQKSEISIIHFMDIHAVLLHLNSPLDWLQSFLILIFLVCIIITYKITFVICLFNPSSLFQLWISDSRADYIRRNQVQEKFSRIFLHLSVWIKVQRLEPD